ncbi:TPA: DUF262 domain-containing protein [Stenotrophomonas maltophilia]
MAQRSSSALLSEIDIDEWFDSEEADGPGVELSDEELSSKYSESQIRIVRSSLDFALNTLVSLVRDRSYINLSPGYQRRARWDRRKKSLLIESLLMNVPIPSLFLFEREYNQYEVMDGRQRLEAISEFLEDKFSLVGLEFWPELHGKKFSDLPGTIQRGLLRRTVNSVVLLAETSRTDDLFDIRLILFRRLNTGGVKLNPQELRNALYPGLFNQLLHDLSRSDLFSEVWRIPQKTIDEDDQPSAQLLKNVLYRSMMDCELVLRFFSIRNAVNGVLRGSLRQIFDQTMKMHAEDSEVEIKALRSAFETALARVVEVLGIDFHCLPSGQPSRPLYDALMVAASNLPQLDLRLDSVAIRERLVAALEDAETYDVLVGRGNTLDSIKNRVNVAMEILLGSR